MDLDSISEKVAKDNNLSEFEVKRVNRSQYKFILDTIQSGDFNPVQLMYVGKFIKNKKYDDDGKRINWNRRRMEKPYI